jgi:hypothetical protein
MPMVKMKSGKTMKFPYTKKGKAAAKKVASTKMKVGGMAKMSKAKAGASIPAAGKSKAAKTVKMATGGMVGKIRSSKVVGTEDEKENKNMKGMKGMMGGGAMYGGKKKKMKDGGVASTTSKSEKDLKKGDMRQVRADMAKKKAAAMKKDRNK